MFFTLFFLSIIHNINIWSTFRSLLQCNCHRPLIPKLIMIWWNDCDTETNNLLGFSYQLAPHFLHEHMMHDWKRELKGSRKSSLLLAQIFCIISCSMLVHPFLNGTTRFPTLNFINWYFIFISHNYHWGIHRQGWIKINLMDVLKFVI